eukprot:5271508-Lingulodinium_polyedra.AAC.1
MRLPHEIDRAQVARGQHAERWVHQVLQAQLQATAFALGKGLGALKLARERRAQEAVGAGP